MNAKVLVALSAVVIVLLTGTVFVALQLGAGVSSTESQSSSSASSSSTSIQTSGSYVNAPQALQLRLFVNASSTGGPQGNVTVWIKVDEYNTLATANNVSKASDWALAGLSLGACGTEGYSLYPYGVALYNGVYTAGNISKAVPLQIFPAVPCPLLLRLITAYLFQPLSDMAVVLPSGPNATATQMSANVTATTQYPEGAVQSSESPLRPGTYTVAAGDEWGSVVVAHFTVGSGAGPSSTTTSVGASSTSMGAGSGTLEATFSVGPTQPVCSVNATAGPAPSSYSNIEAVVTPSGPGLASTFPVAWTSTGCAVEGSVQASLAAGSYSLSLSSCNFMGCSSSLPRSFVITAGLSTSIAVSIDTGIR